MLTQKQQREINKNLKRCAIVGKITIIVGAAFVGYILGYIVGYNSH